VTRARTILTALGLNVVPAFGWFVGEWSAGTTLALYWLETLIGTVLMTVLIVLHRRVRPSSGHFDYRAAQAKSLQPGMRRSSYLAAYLVPALAFTIAHGVFLVALGAVMISNHRTAEARIDPHALSVGVVAVAFFQVVDFSFELVGLAARPFAWIERVGNLTFSRVLVTHFTILIGMAAAMFTGVDRHFFGVFIFLKTLLNLTAGLPQYQPKTPPRWLSALMDRVPDRMRAKGGTAPGAPGNFAKFWQQSDEEERHRLAANEAAVR
jgi:hypothetical protein